MDWQFLDPSEYASQAEHIAAQIISVFYDGFGIERPVQGGWDERAAARMFTRCSFVGVLTEGAWRAGAPIQGYACYICPEQPVEDRRYLLWEDGTCIRKAQQGKKFGTTAVEKALTRAGRARGPIGYVGGRTQNPIIMLQHSKFGPLYPFDIPYTSPDGKRLMGFLRQHIEEVKGDAFDVDTGIYPAVYTEGRLGDYVMPDADRVRAWEAHLEQRGFDRHRGDAVIVIAKRA